MGAGAPGSGTAATGDSEDDAGGLEGDCAELCPEPPARASAAQDVGSLDRLGSWLLPR